MKKVFCFFTLMLSACGLLRQQSSSVGMWDVERNENCAEFSKIKVFQTLDDGALARVCDGYDTKYCSGMVVAITKMWGLELWDDKVITPPKDKCFSYNGTYKYKTKGDDTKTVPVLGFAYKYTSKSGDEAIERLSELAAAAYFECKEHFENKDTSVQTEGLKLCDCTKQATLDCVQEWSNLDDEQKQDKVLFTDLLEEKIEGCAKKYPKAANAY